MIHDQASLLPRRQRAKVLIGPNLLSRPFTIRFWSRLLVYFTTRSRVMAPGSG